MPGCCHQFPQAQRDHGKGGTGAAAERPADHQRHQPTGDHAHQRHTHYRDMRPETFTGIARFIDGIHGMHGRITAHAEEHRMPKRQHATLPQQHVVGHGEHDIDTDHIHQGEGGAAFE